MNDLKVLSLNIWFEDIMEDQRIQSLINLIKYNDIDIICLQEVKPNIYKKLTENLPKYYSYPKNISYHYGNVIFSKYKISKCLTVPFTTSKMGRNLIFAKIDIPHICGDGCVKKIEILVCTSHFESEFKKNIKNIEKLKQYEETFELLSKFSFNYKNIIFCSDTNILNNEEEYFDKFTDANFIDSWKVHGNSNNKFTYDSYCNTYLQLKNPKFRSRLDRILFNCKNLQIIDFILVKNFDSNIIEISDHFGVLTKFEINLT